MTDGSAGARETVDLQNLYKPTSEAVSALTRPSVTLPLPGVGEPARERERERERQRERETTELLQRKRVHLLTHTRESILLKRLELVV